MNMTTRDVKILLKCYIARNSFVKYMVGGLHRFYTLIMSPTPTDGGCVVEDAHKHEMNDEVAVPCTN